MSAPRALICSHYLPQTELDSYSRRLFHLVSILRGAGWEVSCVARSPKGVEPHGRMLDDLGVDHAHGFAEHEANVARALARGRCDLVILGFWVFAEPLIPVVRAARPAARIVVDSGDVHFLREARRRLRSPAAATGPAAGLGPEFVADAARELAVYAAADAVFAVSRKEADLIADLLGRPDGIHVVPDGEDLAPSAVPSAERNGLFFVGNFEHSPNLEALRFLADDVVPRIGQVLLARHPLYVAGSNASDEVRSIADRIPGARFVGWVPSIVPYFERARVSVVPVLHGAGTKRKLIQALSVGTPTVSTRVGVEGFDVGEGDGVLVADEPGAFAEAVARLLVDDALWTGLVERGRERIRQGHSLEVVKERFLSAVGTVCAPAPPIARVTVAEPVDDPAIPLRLGTGARRAPWSGAVGRPELSVVIPTRDRCRLLDLALASLASQDGVEGRIEVVVVDDGSTDDTEAVCRDWSRRMPLVFFRAPAGGISAAKNVGVEAATAPLLLFFDDDDVAAPDLVAVHLAAHRRHPLEQTAVLGYTGWSPGIEVNELMHYVTEEGCQLFCYPYLRHGRSYDFRFFWGGRSSCKRSLLLAAGGFRPEFTFGSEDVEAGYRMSALLARERRARGTGPVQLDVVYESRASQRMVRPMTFDDYCRRCERQGRSQRQFARFYDDPVVAEWCGTTDAAGRWEAVRGELPGWVERIRELEAGWDGRIGEDTARRRELHRLYGLSFDAFKLKGIVAATADESAGDAGEVRP